MSLKNKPTLLVKKGNSYILYLTFLIMADDSESIVTMLASQEVLMKDWDNDADERWNHVTNLNL